MLRSKSTRWLLLLGACYSVGGFGQSKGELRDKVVALESSLQEKKAQLVVQQDSLRVLRERNLQLKLLIHALRDSVQEQALALVQREQLKQLDSADKEVVARVFAQQKKYYASPANSVKERLEKQKDFEEQQLANCLKFEAYQTLFMETCLLEYEVFTNTQTFTGYLKTQYIPDFGEVEFHIEEVSGTYTQNEEIRVLSITEIGGAIADAEIAHHLLKPHKSELHYKSVGSPKLYTKEVPLHEMEVSECD